MAHSRSPRATVFTPAGRKRTALVPPVADMPIYSQVGEAIKDAIFSGRLKPGDPLREVHLAAELSVSQGSVREALVQLQNSGMVVRIPNKETIVTKLSSDEVRERLMMREALEALAWPVAAKRMGPQDYAELERRSDAISAAVDADNYSGLAIADLEFHRYIWASSQHPTLCLTLEQITAPLFAFVSCIHSRNRDRLSNTLNSHEEVIRALRSGRVRAIHRALREHLSGSYDAFLNSGHKDFQDWY